MGQNETLIARAAPEVLTHVVNIGANSIEGAPSYSQMLALGRCTATGFEPQPEALAELRANAGPHETYLPYAVGDGAEHTLYVTRASGMTSLLRPDAARLAMFNGFTDWGEVIATEPISTTTFDDLSELAPVDLLTIDVQGSELDVFRHGRRRLADAVAIQTEVSFMPLYENQPTFADLDAELRGQGFMPHTFLTIKRWAIAPVIFQDDFWAPGNQLLEADVVYVRDITRPDLFSDDQLRHLAAISHFVYGSSDLAYWALRNLEERDAIPPGTAIDFLSGR